MLLSMTGQGEASVQQDGVHVHAELRSVNNRYLKIVPKLSDVISRIESELDGILRKHLKRGSLQVTVRVALPSKDSSYSINSIALRSYLQQALHVAKDFPSLTCSVGDFMALPGVIETSEVACSEDDPVIGLAISAIELAASQLNTMRRREGDSMASQLRQSIELLERITSNIESRAPKVIEDYRSRLEARVQKAINDLKVEFQPSDILREVLLFADKSDIREEIVRLKSHFQQFLHAIEENESQGRKLDFLIQELFRETNTIGSKGNDSFISQSIVEMKTVIEQMRELVQNVE